VPPSNPERLATLPTEVDLLAGPARGKVDQSSPHIPKDDAVCLYVVHNCTQVGLNRMLLGLRAWRVSVTTKHLAVRVGAVLLPVLDLLQPRKQLLRSAEQAVELGQQRLCFVWRKVPWLVYRHAPHHRPDDDWYSRPSEQEAAGFTVGDHAGGMQNVRDGKAGVSGRSLTREES
jgi:hypothetical protein